MAAVTLSAAQMTALVGAITTALTAALTPAGTSPAPIVAPAPVKPAHTFASDILGATRSHACTVDPTCTFVGKTVKRAAKHGDVNAKDGGHAFTVKPRA